MGAWAANGKRPLATGEWIVKFWRVNPRRSWRCPVRAATPLVRATLTPAVAKAGAGEGGKVAPARPGIQRRRQRPDAAIAGQQARAQPRETLGQPTTHRAAHGPG